MYKIYSSIIFSCYSLLVNAQCWKSVNVTMQNTIALNSDGTVWVAGDNYFGQVGNGTNNDVLSLVQVGTSNDWMEIEGGDYVSFGIKIDGSLWGWGNNELRALGDGTNVSRNQPVQIAAGSTWKFIHSTGASTFGIKTNGTLWVWGWNTNGQLGQGVGAITPTPTQFGSDSNWKSVHCNGAFTLAVKTDGTLWGWGDNSYGQLGIGVTGINQPIVQIGSSTDWSSINSGTYSWPTGVAFGIKTDGTLWGWGDNNFGLLGNGTTIDEDTPVQLNSDTDWKIVKSAGSSTLALKTDGTLWAWGLNSYNLYGDNTPNPNSIPVQIGLDLWNTISVMNTSAEGINKDETRFGWGSNAYGQLGDGTTDSKNVITQLGLACTTSKVDQKFLNELTLFPNPIEDLLYIGNENNIPIDKIAIINLSGIKIIELFSNETQINVQDLQEGMYFIQIISGENEYQNRFIKL